MEILPLDERLARARAWASGADSLQAPTATPTPAGGTDGPSLSERIAAARGGSPQPADALRSFPDAMSRVDLGELPGARVGGAVYEAQQRGDLDRGTYAALAADNTGSRPIDAAFSAWGRAATQYGENSPEELRARASYLGLRNPQAPTLADLEARLDPQGQRFAGLEDRLRQAPLQRYDARQDLAPVRAEGRAPTRAEADYRLRATARAGGDVYDPAAEAQRVAEARERALRLDAAREEHGVLGEAWNALKAAPRAAYDTAVGGSLDALAALADAMGREGQAADLRNEADRERAASARAFPTDPDLDLGFPSQAGAAVGSTVPFALASGATGGGFLAPAALGATVNAGGQYREADAARAEGLADDGDVLWATVLGGAVGATEAVPIGRMFNRVNRASGGALQRAARNVLAESGEEGLQEWLQGQLNDASARLTYDPDRPYETHLSDALLGAVAGAGMAGALEAPGAVQEGLGNVREAGAQADARAYFREQFDRLQESEPEAPELSARFRDEILAPAVERNPALADAANVAFSEAVEADRAYASGRGLSPRDARRTGVPSVGDPNYDAAMGEAFADFRRQNPEMGEADAAEAFAASWVAENPDARPFDPNVTGAGAPALAGTRRPVPSALVQAEDRDENGDGPRARRARARVTDAVRRIEALPATPSDDTVRGAPLPSREVPEAPSAGGTGAGDPGGSQAPVAPPEGPALNAVEQQKVERLRALAADPLNDLTPDEAEGMVARIEAQARARADQEAEAARQRSQAEVDQLRAEFDPMGPLGTQGGDGQAGARPGRPVATAEWQPFDPATDVLPNGVETRGTGTGNPEFRLDPQAATGAPSGDGQAEAPLPDLAAVAAPVPSGDGAATAEASPPPADAPQQGQSASMGDGEEGSPPLADGPTGPTRTLQRGQRGSVVVRFADQTQADLYDYGSRVRVGAQVPTGLGRQRHLDRTAALKASLIASGIPEAELRQRALAEYDHVRAEANAAPDPEGRQAEVMLNRSPRPQVAASPQVADASAQTVAQDDAAQPDAAGAPVRTADEITDEITALLDERDALEGEARDAFQRERIDPLRRELLEATVDAPQATTTSEDVPWGEDRETLSGETVGPDARVPDGPYSDGEGDPFVFPEGTGMEDPARPVPQADSRFSGRGLTLGDIEAEVGSDAVARLVAELGYASTGHLVNSVNVEVTGQSASMTSPVLQVEADQRTSRGGFPSPPEGVPQTPEGRWVEWRTLPYDDVTSYSRRREATSPEKVVTARREVANSPGRPILGRRVEAPTTATEPAPTTPEPPPVADGPTNPQVADAESRVVMVPVDELYVDPDRFQPRDEEYSAESVERIVQNFDPRELDALRTWTDPADGREYVLAGHSRREAILRLIAEGRLPEGYLVPVDRFEGSEAEAISFAGRENASRTAQTPVESAAALRRDTEGQSRTATRAEAQRRHGREGAMIADLAALDPEGRVLSDLRAFPTGTQEYRDLLSQAQMVGRVRDRFGPLTDAHERELWSYVRDNHGRKRARTLGDFVAFVGDVVERRTTLGEGGEATFEADSPLGLQSLPPRADVAIDAQIAEADKALRDAQTARQRAEKEYATRATGDELARVLSPYDEAVRVAQREALRAREEAGRARTEVKRQTSMFDDARLSIEPAAEAPPLSDEEAEAIRAFAEGAARALGSPVDVVDAISDLPDGARQRADDARTDDRAVPAVFTPQGTYVVLEEVARAAAAHVVTLLQAARSAVAHETLAHAGPREALGEAGERDLLDSIWRAVGRKRIEESGVWDRYRHELEAGSPDGPTTLTDADRRLMASEYLGWLAGRSGALDPSIRSKVGNALRRAWHRLFGRTGPDAADHELEALLFGLRDFLRARRAESGLTTSASARTVPGAFSAVSLDPPAAASVTDADLDPAAAGRWRAAEAAGLDDDPQTVEARALAGVALSDAERALLVRTLAALDAERAGHERRAADLFERGDAPDAKVEATRAQAKRERAAAVVAALVNGSVHAPDALRRLDLDGRHYALDSVVREAELSRGERLADDERARLAEAVAKAEQADERVRWLEGRTEDAVEARAAREAERRAEATRRAEERAAASERARAARQEAIEAIRQEREEILREAARLGYKLHDVTGVAAEGADILRRLAWSFLREAAYTLPELVAKVQEAAPWATRREIVEAIAGQVPTGKKKGDEARAEQRDRRDLARAYAERTRQRAAVREAHAALTPTDGWRLADEVLNAPRAFLAVGDFSAFGNQSNPLLYAHPLLALKALGTSIKNIRTADAEAVMARYRLDPNHYAREAAGLFVAPVGAEAATVGLDGREETFRGSGLIERASPTTRTAVGAALGTLLWGPGVGTAIGAAAGAASGMIVRGSANQFNVLGNLVRMEVFDRWLASNPDATLEETRALASVLNAATGRGTLGPLGDSERAKRAAAMMIFAPRFLTARFQLPLDAVNPKVPAPARRYAQRIMGSKIAGGLVLSYLFQHVLGPLLGDVFEDDEEATVGWDPRSADFGKVVVGRMRFSLHGGYEVQARLVGRLLAGVADAWGVTETPEGRRAVDPAAEVGRFLAGKKAPWITVLFSLATREDFLGRPVSLRDILEDATVPISAQESLDAVRSGDGRDAWTYAAISAALNTFGFNASVWDDPLQSAGTLRFLAPAGYPYGPSGPARGDFDLPDDLDAFERQALRESFRARLAELIDGAASELDEIEDETALREAIQGLARDARELAAAEHVEAFWAAREGRGD